MQLALVVTYQLKRERTADWLTRFPQVCLMTAGKRPGGLTALAVLNFVFGGLGVLGVLGMCLVFVFLLSASDLVSDAAAASGDVAADAVIEAWREAGMGFFYLTLVLSLLSTVLLIASGVGYLQQKKFLGRTLGSAYALLAILRAFIDRMLLNEEAGGGFGLATVVGLIYPFLTLFLLNTTFKEDLVR